MLPTSVIEISLAAIEHNIRVLRGVVGPKVGICPILKADAYGLGAVRIARHLSSAGVDMIAVYAPDQAAELLAAGVERPMLMLMPVRAEAAEPSIRRALERGRVHLTVHDEAQLADLARVARGLEAPLRLHVEIDTGMGRGGCSPGGAPGIVNAIAADPRLVLAGVMTHFASADADDALTTQQLRRLDAVLARCGTAIGPDCLVHAANSFATFRDRSYHRSMVRVGLAWAGYAAELMRGPRPMAEASSLRPVLTWISQIVHVKTIPAGARVGYGQTWEAPRDSRIALVPVGYADGYPHRLTPIGRPEPLQVAVLTSTSTGELRRHAPVVGAVNMDQITIDVTGIEPLEPGAAVEIISTDRTAPNHLPALAALAGRLPHDLMCGLHPRIPRRYVQDRLLVETKPTAVTV
jgi:alanine racemase